MIFDAVARIWRLEWARTYHQIELLHDQQSMVRGAVVMADCCEHDERILREVSGVVARNISSSVLSLEYRLGNSCHSSMIALGSL